MTAWSLRRRLAGAIAALAVLLIGLVVIAIVLLVNVRAQQRAVIDRYFTAVSTSDRRYTQQIDAETAIRGYALTANPVTLQPLTQFRSPSYTLEAAKLHALLHGDPTTTAALDAWDQTTQAWYDRWAVPTIAAVKANGRDQISPQQVLVGKALFDANRAKFLAYSNQLVSRRDAASNDLKLRTTLLFAAVLLVIASVALVAGASWWALRRWVLVPISDLGAETRLVRSGSLDHEIMIDGPTEVRRLASDIEDMRGDLVNQLAAVEQARREIEASRVLLEAQAQELARSNRDLEQFAYVASHDLQEPLRKVASFCQILERRYSGQLDERADQYIAFAVDGATRMQQLINDLLAFSRVGRLTEGFVEVDLGGCLDAAIDNLAITVTANDARISGQDLPIVSGDPALLTQLFQNLISNSIKFRRDATPQIWIRTRRVEDCWEISCADNGLGIEAQYAERIFVIFQRLHGKDEYPGTGIGLALCKRIVEHHGGLIWLDTSVTAGATFRWTLPAIDSATVDSSTISSLELT